MNKLGKNKLACLLLIPVIVILFILPETAHAQGQDQTIWDGMRWMISPIGQAFGYRNGTPPDIRSVIAIIIRIFLLLLSSIFMALTVYGGYIYMTAYGETEKVEKGKGILRTGIVGITIIFTSYAITRFVVIAAFCATRDYSDFCLFITRVF